MKTVEVMVIENTSVVSSKKINIDKDGSGLKDMQAIVGGYIALVKLTNTIDMYVHDEGKLIGLPVNSLATLLYQHFRNVRDDIIVGPAFLCSSNEDGNVIPLSANDKGEIDRLITTLKAFAVDE